MTFTSANWSVAQTATVTGQNDCALDGKQSYQILLGGAATVDPNYIGIVGRPVSATNADASDIANSTNSPDIHICGYTLVSQSQPGAAIFEYVLSVQMTNIGLSALGVRATLSGMPATVTLPDNLVVVGAIATDETIKSNDTVTLRSTKVIANPVTFLKPRAVWSVIIQR